MKRLLSAIGLILLLAAGQASANIMYSFSGATFSDGGTLTGTFTTNDARTSLLTFDITTSTNGAFGFHYIAPGVVSFSSLPAILVLETPSLNPLLQTTFLGGLTATGAPITIGQFDSFEQASPTAPHRTIVAGQVVAVTASVPEPASLALFAIALGAFGLSRRRKTS